MATTKTYVTEVDRLSGDLVIRFQDNRTAVFPACLLYATLPQADELFESELELDDEPQATN
jgi:hypothetical protein